MNCLHHCGERLRVHLLQLVLSHYIVTALPSQCSRTYNSVNCKKSMVTGRHFIRRIHFVVLCRVEQSQVELSLISHRFTNCRDLLLHHIQRSVHCVVEFQLTLHGNTPDIQRVILHKHRCNYITESYKRKLAVYCVDVCMIPHIGIVSKMETRCHYLAWVFMLCAVINAVANLANLSSDFLTFHLHINLHYNLVVSRLNLYSVQLSSSHHSCWLWVVRAGSVKPPPVCKAWLNRIYTSLCSQWPIIDHTVPKDQSSTKWPQCLSHLCVSLIFTLYVLHCDIYMQ